MIPNIKNTKHVKIYQILFPRRSERMTKIWFLVILVIYKVKFISKNMSRDKNPIKGLSIDLN